MDPVEELLFELLDRPDHEWSVALAAACVRHPEHASELRRRFALLEHSGVTTSSTPTGVDGELPERFGPYRLTQRLGGGGMGVVYRARHEALGRDVALKLVRPELLYFAGSRTRFAREIEAVARLEHPGCVQIHQVGEEHGIPYFAMELVGGLSFEELIGVLRTRATEPSAVAKLTATELVQALRRRVAGDVPSDSGLFVGAWPRAAVRSCLAAAEALAHAHARGVVHRDVKPSNLMLTPTGRVVVIDFGLAVAEGASRMTRTGALLGSLPYMAPEQVRGEHGAVDARTDVYALGVCLYELLSLVSPFESSRAEATRARIESGQVQPLRVLNPAVDSDLATVCARAIEVDPARRYQSMHAFAADLAALLEHRPIAARPAGLFRQTTRWARRRPALATATLLGAIVVVVGPLIVSLAVAGQRDRAVLAERAARRGEYAANLQSANLALAAGNGALARRHLRACPEDLRGFEWRHLHAATNAALLTVKAHADAATAVAMTADARIWVSGSFRGELAVFDGTTGQRQRAWRGSEHAISSLTLDAPGSTLFAVDASQHLRVFDCATGHLLRERAPLSALDYIVVGAQARSIVCAVGPGHFVTFDPATLAVRKERRLRAGESWPGREFVGDEHHVIGATASGGFAAWSLDEGRLRHWVDGHVCTGQMVASPDLAQVASVGSELPLTWWKPGSDTLRALDVGMHGPTCIAFTPDGRRLLLGCRFGEVVVFDLALSRIERRVYGAGWALALATAEHGLLLVGGADGTLRLCSAVADPNAFDVRGAGFGDSLAVAEGVLLTGGKDAVVRSTDLASGVRRWQVSLPHWVNALAIVADGLVAASYHERICLLELATGVQRATIELPRVGYLKRMVSDANGRRLACLTTNGKLVMVDVVARTAGAVIDAVSIESESGVGAVAWDRVRDVVLVAGREPFIVVVDPAQGVVRERLQVGCEVKSMLCEGEDLWTSEMADKPRRAYLRRRQARDGSLLQERPTSISAVSLIRVEDRIVVGEFDGQVTIHDRQNLDLLLGLPQQAKELLNLAASADGQFLAVQGYPKDPRMLIARRGEPDSAGARRRALVAAAADLASAALDQSGSSLSAHRRIEAAPDLDPTVRRFAIDSLPPASEWSWGNAALALCVQPDAQLRVPARLSDLKEALLSLPDIGDRVLGSIAVGMLELRLGDPRAALERVVNHSSADVAEKHGWLLAKLLFVRARAHYAMGDAQAAAAPHAALTDSAPLEPYDWAAHQLLAELDAARAAMARR